MPLTTMRNAIHLALRKAWHNVVSLLGYVYNFFCNLGREAFRRTFVSARAPLPSSVVEADAASLKPEANDCTCKEDDFGLQIQDELEARLSLRTPRLSKPSKQVNEIGADTVGDNAEKNGLHLKIDMPVGIVKSKILVTPKSIPDTSECRVETPSSTKTERNPPRFFKSRYSPKKAESSDGKVRRSLSCLDATPKGPEIWKEANYFKRRFGVSSESSPIYPRGSENVHLGDISAFHRTETSDSTDFSDHRSLNKPERYTVKRLSLPNIWSGGIVITNNHSKDIKFSGPANETLNVPHKTFQLLTRQNLLSGGTVVFAELSKHISLPNIYAQNPLILKDIPIDIKCTQIAPIRNLINKRKFCRSLSGGDYAEESLEGAIFLPEIFPNKLTEEPEILHSYSQKSMSSGGTLDPQGQVLFSEIVNSHTY